MNLLHMAFRSGNFDHVHYFISFFTSEGVLVDTPGDLNVQPMLTSHSSLLSRPVLLPGPTGEFVNHILDITLKYTVQLSLLHLICFIFYFSAEITLDEDDIFQCGRCKKVFTSFHQFMLHKQEHQIACMLSCLLLQFFTRSSQ